MPLLTRRNFLLGLAGTAVAAAGSAGYVRWAEPRWLELDRVRVPHPGLGAPIRVLHLSDFHASNVVPLEFIDHAITLGLAERPDLIALTGDFITTQFADFPRYASILSRLSASAPTFACAGNHDGGVWARLKGGYPSLREVIQLLRAANIRFLLNGAAPVRIRGQPLVVSGVGDYWSANCFPAAVDVPASVHPGAPRILLCHNPDAKTLVQPAAWDLMLCGHTHGGQVRLPIIGTPFAPVRDKRYVEGLHRWDNRWLYITRGVGNLFGIRFNCRPQVSIIDIG